MLTFQARAQVLNGLEVQKQQRKVCPAAAKKGALVLMHEYADSSPQLSLLK